METSRKYLLAIVLYFGYCTNPSITQGVCQTYTLIKVPGARPLTPTQVSSSNCSSDCFNERNCYGFSVQNGNCLLNKDSPNSVDYTASNSNYSVLLRDASNCNTARNCTYSWSGTKNVHGQAGTKSTEITINGCLKSCQDDGQCTGLDWDTNEPSCWLFFRNDVLTADANLVYHFLKTCTGPIPAVTSLPTVPVSTSTSISSSSSKISSPASSTTPKLSSIISSAPSLSTNVNTASPTTPSTTYTTTASNCVPQCTAGKQCNATSRQCFCPTSCDNVNYYWPVCGSNGKTYDNDCYFALENCRNNTNVTIAIESECDSGDSGDDREWSPLAIEPAYIVLAGVGGGCLLLVLTAVILLCGYSLNGAETYSTSGTLVKANGNDYEKRIQQMQVEEGDENVEVNPYYNRDELDAPDFTKEENIM